MRNPGAGIEYSFRARQALAALLRVCTACAMLIGVSGMASAAPVSAVSGNFIYAGGNGRDAAEQIAYHVEPVVYHGVEAWRIAWSCKRIDAVHYIRRSDGAPMYVKRTNYGLRRTVEIRYSMQPGKPHIYRRESADETVIRRLRETQLTDMGALPQLLAGLQASNAGDEFHFSGINYNDGHVYPLLARRVGYASVNSMGVPVRCAIYEVNLDSWKAAFSPTVRLLVPTMPGLANFAAYDGPDPAGGGKRLSLRIIARDGDMAALEASAADSTTVH